MYIITCYYYISRLRHVPTQSSLLLLTIDRDLNAAINVLRRGMQSLEENNENETEHVGRGTPEVTPVEIGSIPERANPVVETGSLRL